MRKYLDHFLDLCKNRIFVMLCGIIVLFAIIVLRLFSLQIIQGTKYEESILPDGLEEEEYAIGFRKADQALRDEVQKILSEMKADGKLGEISTEWFGSDITTVK